MTYAILKRLWEVEKGPGQDDLDQFGLCWTPQDGNCSGVTNWIALDSPEKVHWRMVNTGVDGYSITEKEQYAVHENPGFMFYAKDGKNGLWRWPSILIGSMAYEPGKQNIVKIVDEDKGYYNIETIPVVDDLSLYSPMTHPWLYIVSYATNKKNVTHYTKAGLIYQPLWSPFGRVRANGNCTGMWLRRQYVHSFLSELPPYVPPKPSNEFWVTVLRRSVLRCSPNKSAKKSGYVAHEGEALFVSELSGEWGLTLRGWVQMKDTVRK
jgi:hypothetical protein